MILTNNVLVTCTVQIKLYHLAMQVLHLQCDCLPVALPGPLVYSIVGFMQAYRAMVTTASTTLQLPSLLIVLASTIHQRWWVGAGWGWGLTTVGEALAVQHMEPHFGMCSTALVQVSGEAFPGRTPAMGSYCSFEVKSPVKPPFGMLHR